MCSCSNNPTPRRQGEGQLKTRLGEKYTGQFFNDTRHGEGTNDYPNGDVYVGQWARDARHGKGFLIDNDARGSEYCFESST